MFDIHKTSAAAYLIAVDGECFRYADANQACLRLTQVASRFAPGLTPHDVLPSSVADDVIRRYRACVDGRQAISYLAEHATATGARSWRTTLLPILDADGTVVAIVGICSEASEAIDSHPKLSLNDKASLAIETIDGGYWVYEVADDTFETSRPLAELLAGPGKVSLNLAEYLSHVHSEDLGHSGLRDPEQDFSVVEYRVVTFEGRMLWLKSRRRILRDETGAPVRVVGLVADITAQKLALQTLEVEATTDPLTAVKNRRAFDRAAAQSFRESHATGKPVGLLLIDLDDFKPINDRYGHRAGDEVLRKAARRISRFTRKSDCVARVGGDEFALLLRGASSAIGEPLALRIRKAFAKPFTVEGHAVFVSVSTGLAVATAEDQTIEALFERADRNLYAMKQGRQIAQTA